MFDHAARDGDVRDMAFGAAAIERLWDACQIPDYRKIAPTRMPNWSRPCSDS